MRLNHQIGDLALEPGARRAVLVTFTPCAQHDDAGLGGPLGGDWRIASSSSAGNLGQLRPRTLRLLFHCKLLPYSSQTSHDSMRLDNAGRPQPSRSSGDSANSARQFTTTVVCKAQTCSSLISVQPSSINLGDCNVGEFKSTSIEVRNLSDLPTVVVPHVVSKVKYRTSPHLG
jgi:hypothetical protein